MKPLKSIVLLTVGMLAFASCSKKQQEEAVGTNIGTGAAAEKCPVCPVCPTVQKEEAPIGAAALGGAAVGAHMAKKKKPAKPQEEEYNADDNYSDEALFEDTTTIGTGKSSDDYEYIDETASEPNGVKGGRDPRMVPKNNSVHHTSSDPFAEEQ